MEEDEEPSGPGAVLPRVWSGYWTIFHGRALPGGGALFELHHILGIAVACYRGMGEAVLRHPR